MKKKLAPAIANQLPARKESSTAPISEQETRFVESYVETGGDLRAALKHAGYSVASDSAARALETVLFKRDRVIKKLRETQRNMLSGKLATIALGTIERILKDDTAPQRLQLDAAKFAIEQAGFQDSRFELPQGYEEMPVAKLQELLRTNQQTLAEIRAQGGETVDILPESVKISED